MGLWRTADRASGRIRGCRARWTTQRRVRRFGVVALHVRRHVGIGVGEFGLEELDDALDAGAGGEVRDAHALALALALALRGDHLHELTAAQHQGLQPLQLGVGQQLDEALALGVLVQHSGERRQHPGVQRIGLGQRTHRAGEVAPCAG